MMTENKLNRLEFRGYLKNQKYFLLTIFILLVGMAQLGFIKYNTTKKEVEKSSNLEEIMPTKLKSYNEYGVYGVRFHSIPSPFSFLENFKISNCMTTSLSTGTCLKISETKKGYNVFTSTLGGYLSYSGLFLVFLSILYFYNGWDTLRDKPDLKFFSCLKGLNPVLSGRSKTKLVFLSGFILVLSIGTAILGSLNGINLFRWPFFYFFLENLIIMPIFFFLGGIAAQVSPRKIDIHSVTAIVFVVSMIIAPVLISMITLGISSRLSEFETETNQFEILTAFETRGKVKFGDQRGSEEFKNFVKSYKENELAIIEGLEKKLMEAIEDDISVYNALSCLFPTTFYLSASNELSGQGFNNYLELYDFSRKQKREFFDFWSDKKYFSPQEQGPVESFIKGNRNVFYHRPSVPSSFFILLGWYLLVDLLLGVSMFRLAKKGLYPIKVKLEEENRVLIPIYKGKPSVLFTDNTLLKDKIYNHLSKIENTRIEIALMGLNKSEAEPDFFYLPNPACIKNINANDLHYFLFNTPGQRPLEKWEILLEYAKQEKKFMVLEEFAETLSPSDFEEIACIVKEEKLYCLIITSNYYFALGVAGGTENLYCPGKDATSQWLIKELENRPVKADPPIPPETSRAIHDLERYFLHEMAGANPGPQGENHQIEESPPDADDEESPGDPDDSPGREALN